MAFQTGPAGDDSPHRTFALVLAGGGARGYAHAGVLRALERYGYRPSALVGVSMGAVVGTAWAARADWYETLLALDTNMFPGPVSDQEARGSFVTRLRKAWSWARTAEDLLFSWGPGARAVDAGRAFLDTLIGARQLEELSVPVAVCATDLRSTERVVFRAGDATTAVYASAALAGVLPPLPHDRGLLADGAYADVAPIDVARTMGAEFVLAVDPGQLMPAPDIGNGLQAVLRATEICHRRHADLRFDQADLVLRPRYRRPIDTLEFEARRECVAAGIREVRAVRARVAALLG
ncbi:MAG: patatin-like phospholipase family protein [Gemmatimonadetes bacterium]|nr:patatin-like phospholipase family protein [Gemmatimonadota bacterium]NNK63960.1 hypothetical protein [Gemmatimonadota bacterium]